MNLKLLLLAISAVGQGNQFVDVAIMHSATGTMAISEITVINAEILAIEEINADGGVLGRQIRHTIFDGQSNPDIFNQKAIEITSNASFVTTFGCWTSSSRKAVLPVFESTNKQLWYPVQYEGQECSKNVFYSGATPNQQIEPSVIWLLDNYPRNMFLIGSDYVFPRTANDIIKSMLRMLGGNLIGEEYAVMPQNPADSAANNIKIGQILDTILAQMPNGCVIYNSLNGDANVQLFTLMEQKGMTPDRYPTMSVSITETEAAEIGINKLVGHFAAWNYFMSDPNMVARKYDDYMSLGFINRYRRRFGNSSLVNDPMEAAYINVYVWAAAVERAQSFDVDRVRRAAYGISFDAPEGVITMQSNHHISKYPRIGRFRTDGLFDVVWEGTNPVYPVPWNQYIAETNGQFCNHQLNTPDASRFSPPQVRVALLYDPLHADILKAQMISIENINQASNGVNSQLIVPNIININWDRNTILNSLVNVSAVFGTNMNQTISTRWTEIASSSSFLTFIPYSTALWNCSRNVIRMDLTTPQLLDQSLTWFEKNNFAGFYFVGDGTASSLSALSFVREKYLGLIPEIGASQLVLGQNNSALITTMVNSIIASNRPRVGIISTFPGNDPTNADLYSGLRRLGSIRFRVLSTNVNEEQLTADMVGHFSVSSYFQSIIIPENSVFVSSFQAKYGPQILTADMVQSYNAIQFWARSAEKARSVNPTRVRVNMYDTTFSTPSGQIRVTKSNRVAAPYRIAQVIRAGTSLFYRPIVGLDDTTNLVQQPPLQVEGDVCYFGAVKKQEPETTPLRVVTVGLSIFAQCVLITCMVWVTYHRKKLVIRHTGYDFLMLNLIGSFFNLTYIYFVYPYEMTSLLCQGKNYPGYIGFYLMFGTLIHKCYSIFEATRKKSITSKTRKVKAVKMVGVFFFLIMVALIVKTLVETDLIVDQIKVLEEGVLYERHSVCTTTLFDWGLTFSCVLICIIGCVLAVQIRNVDLPFNESFHMGSAVYSWTFTKIVLEVIKQFAPYNHEIFFFLDTWGEIFPNLDTAFAFLIPKYKLIRAGKGDDEHALRSLSVKSSVSSGQTASAKQSVLSGSSNANSVPPTYDALVFENRALKKKLADAEKSREPTVKSKKTVSIDEEKEADPKK